MWSRSHEISFSRNYGILLPLYKDLFLLFLQLHGVSFTLYGLIYKCGNKRNAGHPLITETVSSPKFFKVGLCTYIFSTWFIQLWELLFSMFSMISEDAETLNRFDHYAFTHMKTDIASESTDFKGPCFAACMPQKGHFKKGPCCPTLMPDLRVGPCCISCTPESGEFKEQCCSCMPKSAHNRGPCCASRVSRSADAGWFSRRCYPLCFEVR